MVMARGCCAGSYEAQLLRSLLEACGQCEEVPEAQVDVHTGLSGSGVAFVCAFSEALAEGAIKMGMPSGLAHRIAAQTLLGTAKVLLQKGQHPAQLRTDVCTPGGTTIYGLHVLEQGGLRATAMSAVEAATCRARSSAGTSLWWLRSLCPASPAGRRGPGPQGTQQCGPFLDPKLLWPGLCRIWF